MGPKRHFKFPESSAKGGLGHSAFAKFLQSHFKVMFVLQSFGKVILKSMLFCRVVHRCCFFEQKNYYSYY